MIVASTLITYPPLGSHLVVCHPEDAYYYADRDKILERKLWELAS